MKETSLKSKDGLPSKQGKSVFAKVVAWIHLWPSLISALVLIFVCLTGTIIVYCDEIMDFVNRDVLYVERTGEVKLPAEVLLSNYHRTFPGRRNPSYMVVYKDPSRSVKMNSFDPAKGLSFVFMDPYTGKVLKEDRTIYFFYITAHLHGSFLWHGPGNWIVGVSTVIFLVELITGLILWWPDKWNKTTRQASFKIKWNARFKRLNYDLHNVLGFYALSICLVLTITGILISFKPVADFTMRLAGGDPGHGWEKSLTRYVKERKTSPINVAIDRLFASHPEKLAAQVMTYRIDTVGYYQVNLAKRIGLKSCEDCDAWFIDRYTGHPIPEALEASEHENIENGYWALHMGTWMGQFGKFVTFTGGLIATSLPITGFLIWWGRRKKAKRKPGKRVLRVPS